MFAKLQKSSGEILAQKKFLSKGFLCESRKDMVVGWTYPGLLFSFHVCNLLLFEP